MRLKSRIQKKKKIIKSFIFGVQLIFKIFVVVDTCDSCTDTKSFFDKIASIIEFLHARKRTVVFLKYPKQKKRRLKRFSNTRWTFHDLNV